MTDSQLQARGGKNLPAFLGVSYRVSSTLRKLTDKTTVVLENLNDEALIISQYIDSALINRTTSPVEATFYIENEDGYRAEVSSFTLPLDFEIGMESELVYLNKGERLVLVISSAPSILTGGGLWLETSVINPPAPLGSPDDRKHTRLTGTTFIVQPRPGVTTTFISLSLENESGIQVTVTNYSSEDLLVDSFMVTPEGELTLLSGASLGANEVTLIGGRSIPQNGFYKLVFAALPTTGPVVVNVEYLFPANRFDLS